MTPTYHISVRARYAQSSGLALIASLAFVQSAQADTLYWDADGATPGFTRNPAGTWGSSAFWSTDSTGSSAGANTTTTSLDSVNFGVTDSGFSGAASVSISGTQEVKDTSVAGNSGLLTLTGGTAISLGTGSKFTTNINNSNLRIDTILTGTAGFTKAGNGYVELNYTGTGGLSGTITNTQGALLVNKLALTNVDFIINGGFVEVGFNTTENSFKSISLNGGYLGQRSNTDVSSKFSTAAGQQYKFYAEVDTTYATALTSSGGTLDKALRGNITLAAANTFNGSTKVTGGTLILGNSSALQNSAIDTAKSVTGTSADGFAVSGVTAVTFGGLTGNKNLASVFNTTTGNYSTITSITLNPGTGNKSYSGVIPDGAAGMSLTKTGSGTQELTVANTYIGGTNINEGTLATGGTGNFGTGNVTVQNGAFLTLGNASSIADTATLTFAGNSTASGIDLGTFTETVDYLYNSLTRKYFNAGTYNVTQLNSSLTNSVFTGSGSLIVAASAIPLCGAGRAGHPRFCGLLPPAEHGPSPVCRTLTTTGSRGAVVSGFPPRCALHWSADHLPCFVL